MRNANDMGGLREYPVMSGSQGENHNLIITSENYIMEFNSEKSTMCIVSEKDRGAPCIDIIIDHNVYSSIIYTILRGLGREELADKVALDMSMRKSKFYYLGDAEIAIQTCSHSPIIGPCKTLRRKTLPEQSVASRKKKLNVA